MPRGAVLMALFAVIAPLAPFVADVQSIDHWSPHVTVLPGFRSLTPRAELAERLTAAARTFRMLDMALGRREWFGPDRNVPVLLVAHADELCAWHDALATAFALALVELSSRSPSYRHKVLATVDVEHGPHTQP